MTDRQSGKFTETSKAQFRSMRPHLVDGPLIHMPQPNVVSQIAIDELTRTKLEWAFLEGSRGSGKFVSVCVLTFDARDTCGALEVTYRKRGQDGELKACCDFNEKRPAENAAQMIGEFVLAEYEKS